MMRSPSFEVVASVSTRHVRHRNQASVDRCAVTVRLDHREKDGLGSFAQQAWVIPARLSAFLVATDEVPAAAETNHSGRD
jgi:O-glycosyl hydrolase